MAQKFDYLRTESELRSWQDEVYAISKKKFEDGERPIFKGLMEKVLSEPVILTAIHNIKANKGSKTPGSDGLTIRDAFLRKRYDEVVNTIRTSLSNYKPEPVRRVWIPKPGKKELRPLGIPTIADRVIQECVRIVIEPILEAQFFKHSYGFRPMRDSSMALERITHLVKLTNYHWAIEGDISKFFDNVNHSILIKRLWHMGLRDRRLLMVIKAMLKAGVMNETKENPLGTPQGGIISPLLANVYLDSFDQWVGNQWECKPTSYNYSLQNKKIRALKKTNLRPAYLIRYADDWVILTNTKKNAEEWKRNITDYLKVKLRLELSEEKTLITNIKKKYVRFLGYEYKLVKTPNSNDYVKRTMPNRVKLESKVKSTLYEIKRLRKLTKIEDVIHGINLINSKIRGLINYYEHTTLVNVVLRKYSQILGYAGINSLKRFKAKWEPANKVYNLSSIHSKYRTRLATIKYMDTLIGITCIRFCSWNKVYPKIPEETPYSERGRELFQWRTGKKPLQVRADELLSIQLSELISRGMTRIKYNFEYFMNRAYAFNRDKGRCKICGTDIGDDLETHHIDPKLSIDLVNKVQNLASTHKSCHKLIHDKEDHSHLNRRTWKKILFYREKLNCSL